MLTYRNKIKSSVITTERRDATCPAELAACLLLIRVRQLSNLLGVADSAVSAWSSGVVMIPRHQLRKLKALLSETITLSESIDSESEVFKARIQIAKALTNG